jgi:hypothetical protein
MSEFFWLYNLVKPNRYLKTAFVLPLTSGIPSDLKSNFHYNNEMFLLAWYYKVYKLNLFLQKTYIKCIIFSILSLKFEVRFFLQFRYHVS